MFNYRHQFIITHPPQTRITGLISPRGPRVGAGIHQKQLKIRSPSKSNAATSKCKYDTKFEREFQTTPNRAAVIIPGAKFIDDDRIGNNTRVRSKVLKRSDNGAVSRYGS